MKINYPKRLSLVKIPQEAEFTIFLIKQELKSRVLTNGLNKLGLDGSICIFDFSKLILSTIGFNDRSDAFYDWYFSQLDSFCEDVDLTDATALSELAFDFYVHLLIEKRGSE